MPTPRTENRKPARPAIQWRARRGDSEITGEDKFYIPPEVIPPGMAWEWKRYSALGQEDIDHQVTLGRDGAWDPVPHESWPERLGQFGQTGNAIIVGGLILMQRPEIYSEESRVEEKQKSAARVKNHFASLNLSDGPLPKAKARVKTDYSSVQLVPDDDQPE